MECLTAKPATRFSEVWLRDLATMCFYQMMFEAFDADESKPVTAGLADDLADIFFDVKEGLMRVPADGPVPANVIWDWAFGLESHWGRHAVNAIGALHSLLF